MPSINRLSFSVLPSISLRRDCRSRSSSLTSRRALSDSISFCNSTSAGCVPVEVELQKEIESLKARLDVSDDERERQSLRKEIEGKTLKLNLLMDGIQRARRER